MTTRSFDARFYQRFYMNPRTRVTTREEMARRASMVAALVKQLELPVKRILDAGCGLGWLRAPLLKAFPGATYVGLEVSEHLCRQHGWVQESLASYRPRSRFDLLICYDVMQYLSDREAAQAIANMARLSRGALYFHAPTLEDWRDNADRSGSDGNVNLRNAEDWRDNADRSGSDGNVNLRNAAWYRSRLSRHFEHAGFGVHVRRGVPWGQWELERSD
jgi:trans-aconitate methyltransferase